MRQDTDPKRSERRQRQDQRERRARPLDAEKLEELALAYVARFATSAGKLKTYLKRKVRERGWAEDAPEPEIDALVARHVDKGFVDDEAYARSRSAGLMNRGYGARRVSDQLRAAGIDEDLRERLAPGEAARREAIAAFVRKRRFGPYTTDAVRDADDWSQRREKQLAAMIRAGHEFGHARFALEAPDEDALAQWIAEAVADAEADGEDAGFA